MTLVDTIKVDIQDMTDEELTVLARSSKEAASELISRYAEKVMIKARMLSGKGAEYDDLRQEGLISLLRAIYAYDPAKGAKFSTFSEVCVVNRMRTVCSGADRGICESLDDVNCEEIASGADTPETAYLYKELLIKMKNGITSELSSAERRTLELCIQGVSYRRAALMLGISEKAVDNAVQRARKKLRAIYNNFNVAV
ncbi:MAG: sigma-70 family RNA polymerase sigma factor [Ruminococcus sp.]|nr:sigma-70 family RNA polymerase sigma factor [Ruminococcus sp.]